MRGCEDGGWPREAEALEAPAGRQRVEYFIGLLGLPGEARLLDAGRGDGDAVGSFRIHQIPGVLLPAPGQLRSWGRRLGNVPRRRRVSGRLRFRQVGRHWWGRVSRP
ncbi:MAG: hypothetical protein GXP47_03185 [Acidobacteria bacterium]|nr:hypothetical protein [Acidobacteriota bacterium]